MESPHTVEPATTDQEVLALWQSLARGDLGSRWMRAYHDAYTRREFESIELPAGVTPDGAWDFFRRVTGVARIPLESRPQASSSFALTPHMVTLLHDIDRASALSLDDLFEGMKDTRARFVTRALMGAAIESAIGDRSSISRSDARALLTEGLTPRNDEERSIVNRYRVFSNLHLHADRRFSPDLIAELYRDLTTGIKGADHDGMFRTGDTTTQDRLVRWSLAPVPQPDEIEPRLRSSCDRLEGRPPHTDVGHPLITALIAYFAIADLQPFPLPDMGVPRAVAGLYLYQQGYRILHLLPLSTLLLTSMDSFEGELYGDENPNPDITRFLIHHLERVRGGLQALQRSIEIRAEKERELDARMRHRDDLNRRQKNIVARALDAPDAVFTAKAHQRSYSLSQSTAFRDLQALVEKGLLSQRRVGRAWEYVAESDLREKVAEV